MLTYGDLDNEVNGNSHSHGKSSLAKVIVFEQLRIPQSSDG